MSSETDQLLHITREQAQIGTLTVERLGCVEERLGRVEDVVRASDAKLARLVELGERRDRREEEAAAAELAERTERGRWLRSLLSREVVIPLVAAIGGLVTGGIGLRAIPLAVEAAPAEAAAAEPEVEP